MPPVLIKKATGGDEIWERNRTPDGRACGFGTAPRPYSFTVNVMGNWDAEKDPGGRTMEKFPKFPSWAPEMVRGWDVFKVAKVKVFPPATGVWVGVEVTVKVAVTVGVFVAVSVGVVVGVAVNVWVAVLVEVELGVLVAVKVGLLVAVEVGVLVEVGVGVFVEVLVAVLVDVEVAVLVAVATRVLVGVWVGVRVAVTVGVAVAVLVVVFVAVVVAVFVAVLVGVAVAVAKVMTAPPTPAAGVDETARGLPELAPVPVTLPAVTVTA